MSEKKKRPPRRKIYSFDDMPTVDRDGFDLFGTEYHFVGPQDIGAQFMADARSLQERIPQLELELDEAEEEDEQMQLTEDFLHALMRMTQMLFVEEVPEDALMKISVARHKFIHDSFTEASADDGSQPEEAPEATEKISAT
jgi:hypothetical protein